MLASPGIASTAATCPRTTLDEVPLPAAAPINPGWSTDFHTQADPLLASLDLAGGVMLVSR